MGEMVVRTGIYIPLENTHSLSHAVDIGFSFIGYEEAGGWISRVALFSAKRKKLLLCPLYVSILGNTEKIFLSFNSLWNCKVISLETQEILEDLSRNYHCQ
jgi:hypothetical protein